MWLTPIGICVYMAVTAYVLGVAFWGHRGHCVVLNDALLTCTNAHWSLVIIRFGPIIDWYLTWWLRRCYPVPIEIWHQRSDLYFEGIRIPVSRYLVDRQPVWRIGSHRGNHLWVAVSGRYSDYELEHFYWEMVRLPTPCVLQQLCSLLLLTSHDGTWMTIMVLLNVYHGQYLNILFVYSRWCLYASCWSWLSVSGSHQWHHWLLGLWAWRSSCCSLWYCTASSSMPHPLTSAFSINEFLTFVSVPIACFSRDWWVKTTMIRVVGYQVITTRFRPYLLHQVRSALQVQLLNAPVLI